MHGIRFAGHAFSLTKSLSMKHFRFMAVAIAGTLLFGACKKNVKEEAAAPQESSINYRLALTESAADGAATGKVQSGPITWTSGYINISDVKVEAVRGSQKLQLSTNIMQRFDLFQVVSTIGMLNLPSGTFDRLLFKVKIAQTSGYHAFELKGSYKNNGQTTPIMVQVLIPRTFTFDYRKRITLNPNEVLNSVINFTLSPIASGITESMLNSAERTNGAIVISHKSNAKLYYMIGEALEKHFSIRTS